MPCTVPDPSCLSLAATPQGLRTKGLGKAGRLAWYHVDHQQVWKVRSAPRFDSQMFCYPPLHCVHSVGSAGHRTSTLSLANACANPSPSRSCPQGQLQHGHSRISASESLKSSSVLALQPGAARGARTGQSRYFHVNSRVPTGHKALSIFTTT